MIHRWRALIVALILVPGGLAAQQKADTEYLSQLPPLIDRELFFGDPAIAGGQISPDGRFISFLKTHKGEMNVWVKRVDEPFEAARPITADTVRPVFRYFWSQDGRYILYAQDKGGNENFHIYAVDPTAAAEPQSGVPPARDLTPYENIQARIFAVPEATPDQIVVGLNDRDPQVHDVYRVDIHSGERELVIQNDEGLAGWQTDLDGDVRLGLKLGPTGETQVLRVDGDQLTQVYTCSNEETCGPVRFHKDGRRVYMITNKGPEVDLTRLILFDPQTGAEEFVESDPENQVDFGGAEFSDVTDELVATYYVGDRVRIYPKTDQVKRDLEILRKKLPPGEINLGSSTEDERYHLVSVARDVDPGSTYLYDRKTGDVELLYRSRPELPAEHLAHMKPIRYTARDGLEIPAYLTLPRGVEPKNLPVVIHPHGGPWARDDWGYNGYVQFLANRGYAVLQPNFRGSTGYGKDFLNAGNNEWGTGHMQHDITDGVKYLVERGIADPDRVAIFGGSYGGYATLAGVAFTPDLYAAGVSYVGPSNLITLLNSIPPYWGPIKKIFDVRLGNPDEPEDRERLIAQSPLFSAEQIQAPLLVIQGANDPRVKKAESEQIVVALRDLGRDVAYVLAEDEGHGFASRENRIASAAAMEAFLAEHLGGRFQEEMPENIAARLAELTVDVNTVERPETASASEEEMAAPLPDADGSVIQPGSWGYASSFAVGERELTLNTNRAIEAAETDGRQVWRVISSIQMPGTAVVDTLELDRASLRPVHRQLRGQASIEVNYAEDRVTGEMAFGGQKMPIDVELDAPVFADGTGLELALAGLPLTEGYGTTVRVFDVQNQKVRPIRFQVQGAEETTSGAGTFDTWVVEVTPLDGDDAGSGTMRVMKDAPHYVVRSEQKLPATMGGATAVTELTRIGAGASE